MSTKVYDKPDSDSELLVYFQTDRSYLADTVEVEVVRGSGDSVRIDSLEIIDQEPLDVLGPIFSRIFDELGITLSDPGDFGWLQVPLDDTAFVVTIGCSFEVSA